MATEPDPANISELHSAILDAINRRHVYAADVLDFCGPRLDQQERGMDSAAYLKEIDRLIERGYIEQEGKRFNDQLKLRLTEKGRESAPPLSDVDRTLLDEYGITIDALSILRDVIDYDTEEESLPTISQLQEYGGSSLAAYQYTLLFNTLVDAGLASEKGIFRYRIQPTDAGRAVVEEFADHL